jgi:hypothetical protein
MMAVDNDPCRRRWRLRERPCPASLACGFGQESGLHIEMRMADPFPRLDGDKERRRWPTMTNQVTGSGKGSRGEESEAWERHIARRTPLGHPRVKDKVGVVRSVAIGGRQWRR